ncbi:VOC family protein [Neoroseomonas oryzicola]|uniref:VOC domain-containing protein n=1 Tax=Neoroseomonas oryzicola TaxID=535904 RepID=A0A9X9WD63_9PROT|nr:VOC family protein [Neoroseomonas oryzicola]MBR0658273.1 hypothetical protein [Neoroseomonas oryzicola]NKE18438.1 hypothetical protein [Neoroseomonas oryzicola]
MPDTPDIFPCFRYADAPAALDWLERAFGFARGLVVPDGAGGIAHAQMSVGRGMIMLGSRRGASDDALERALEAGAQVTYLVVADIDAHHARATAAGAEIIRAPFDTDYGSRDYIARDPGGHVWCFGTYDPYAPSPG